MATKLQLLVVCVVLLVLGIFFAGCSDQSDQGTNSAPAVAITPTATPAPTLAGPKYSAGDIVASSSTPSGQGYLIISYSATTDKYNREYVIRNSDGSWGYTSGTSSETADRTIVDKVYTKKVATVNPSAVTVVTPAPTPTSVSVTRTPTPTATVTVTATQTTNPAPVIIKVVPDSGVFNTTVTGVQISGANFLDGATVTLKSAGNTPIAATNVNVASSQLIICSFVIGDVPHVPWDVVVTNPDGQSGILANYFTVHSAS